MTTRLTKTNANFTNNQFVLFIFSIPPFVFLKIQLFRIVTCRIIFFHKLQEKLIPVFLEAAFGKNRQFSRFASTQMTVGVATTFNSTKSIFGMNSISTSCSRK
ncbi:MAG: hypothetical protein C4324_09480 [Blastocatellia bacterium]